MDRVRPSEKTHQRYRDLGEELAGAHLFDPMGGRPMKEWVVFRAARLARTTPTMTKLYV